MAVSASILLALRAGGDMAPCRAELDDLGSDFAGDFAPGDYYRAVSLAARNLLAALVENGTSSDAAAKLAEQFREAWAISGDASELDSLLGHLRLLAAILSDREPTRAAAAWVASIEDAAGDADQAGTIPAAAPAPAQQPA
jgi:hypothetical protein